MFRRVVVLFMLCLVAGCTAKGCKSEIDVKDKDKDAQKNIKATNGLSGDEQDRFHHLAEGSELVPLSWLLALENDDGEPFLDNPQRFGLLAGDKSAENPAGLPIGLTSDYTRDLRFAGTKMVGVNCAGCHVNELHLKGKPVIRIDGAPNLFDLELFLGQVANAAQKTFADSARAWRFVRKLYELAHPDAGNSVVARVARSADKAVASYKSLDDMNKGAMGKSMAATIEKLHAAEKDRAVPDLNKGVVTRSDKQSLLDYSKAVPKKTVKPTAELRDAARALRAKTVGKLPATQAAEIAKVSPTRPSKLADLAVAERATAIGDALEHFVETIRLLKARAAFLRGLITPSDLARTAPGFGRVDAFGSARNRFFPGDKKPTTAPISFPHLWGLKDLLWLHWDANTTSELERNAGQAIGLGALFDPDTFDSTLIVANLKELEKLSHKIEPPKWPEAFGKIDAAKAKRGAALFEKHCQECHRDGMGGKGKGNDSFPDMDKLGTDATRAKNFAEKADGKEFDVALSDVLKKLVREAGGTPSADKEWRLTRKYPNRPLKAIWATAPYLHNNSVPTLYDLLLPAADRPKTFAVGSRDYDPEKLGYKSDGDKPFLFDTTKTGNGNGGHEYGTDMTKDQRMEVLEYLKTQ